VFPGEQRQLGLLRRWLASLLPECASRDDVVGVATELASNALLHTASGRGGTFGVEIAAEWSVVRVAITDGGSPAGPRLIDDPDGEHGRGLLLVHGLSVRTGVTGDQRGRIVWADVAWQGPALSAPAEPAILDEASIRDGEAELARRFVGVPAWFGRSTQAWWALVGSGLVTAPTAHELAGLLYRLLDDPTPPRPAAAGQVPSGSVGQPTARTGANAGIRRRRRPSTGSAGLGHPFISRGPRGAVRTPAVVPGLVASAPLAAPAGA
jgi:hypothetical protein